MNTVVDSYYFNNDLKYFHLRIDASADPRCRQGGEKMGLTLQPLGKWHGQSQRLLRFNGPAKRPCNAQPGASS